MCVFVILLLLRCPVCLLLYFHSGRVWVGLARSDTARSGHGFAWRRPSGAGTSISNSSSSITHIPTSYFYTGFLLSRFKKPVIFFWPEQKTGKKGLKTGTKKNTGRHPLESCIRANLAFIILIIMGPTSWRQLCFDYGDTN